jgi:hypothetical protein
LFDDRDNFKNVKLPAVNENRAYFAPKEGEKQVSEIEMRNLARNGSEEEEERPGHKSGDYEEIRN